MERKSFKLPELRQSHGVKDETTIRGKSRGCKGWEGETTISWQFDDLYIFNHETREKERERGNYVITLYTYRIHYFLMMKQLRIKSRKNWSTLYIPDGLYTVMVWVLNNVEERENHFYTLENEKWDMETFWANYGIQHSFFFWARKTLCSNMEDLLNSQRKKSLYKVLIINFF